VTAHSTLSTLGVILAACTAAVTAHSQTAEGSAPPTAGFADVPTGVQSAPSAAEVAPTTAPATTIAAPPPSNAYTYTPPPRPALTSLPAQQSPEAGYGYGYGYSVPSSYYAPQNDGRTLGYNGATGTNDGNVGADRGGDDSSKKSSEKPEHFRIGVLGGVGFPRPLAIEGMIKIEKILGLGIEYSAMPSLSIEGVDTSFHAIAATARLFPFKNGFFIGLRAGRQHLGGEGTVTVAPYGTYHESVTVDSTFINPRIGFLWTWDPGITLGIDAGVQVPVGATVSSSLPAGTQANKDVMDVANTLGNTTLPTIDLLKVGFLL